MPAGSARAPQPPSRRSGESRGQSGAPTVLGTGAAVLLLVLVPLAFDPRGYYTFLPLKWTLCLVLVGLGLAGLILRAGLSRPTLPLYAWLVFLTILGLATVTGSGGITSVIGSPGRYLGLVAWASFAAAFWLGTSVGRSPPNLRTVARAASAAAVPVALYALAQTAGIDPMRWSAHVDLRPGALHLRQRSLPRRLPRPRPPARRKAGLRQRGDARRQVVAYLGGPCSAPVPCSPRGRGGRG